MKYSLQMLKKQFFFSRDSNILPQMHWTLDSFGNSATIIGGLGVSLKYPILNFKKTVWPKNVSMRHCRIKVFHKCFSSISQQTFVGLQHVLKTSSTRLQRNNFTCSKTSWRRLANTSWRRLEDVFKTSRKTSNDTRR